MAPSIAFVRVSVALRHDGELLIALFGDAGVVALLQCSTEAGKNLAKEINEAAVRD